MTEAPVMRKSLAFGVVVFLLAGPACAHREYIYHEGVEWVKIVPARGNVSYDHPREIAPELMKTMLGSIHFSKKIIFFKDVEHALLLNDEAQGRFALYFSQAFARFRPDQVVAFSIVVKDPKLVIFRDDRLTTGRVYVQGSDLVFSFDKLNAKLLGDSSNVGGQAHAAQRAQSIRTALELGPGQKGSYDDPDILILDLNYDWLGKRPEGLAGPVAPPKTEGPSASSPVHLSPEERLRQLKRMLEDELITEAEYDRKRAEILKEM